MASITSNELERDGKAVNFQDKAKSTISANRMSNYARTKIQQDLLKRRVLAQDKKAEIKCPNCKTKEKKYIKTKVNVPYDKYGEVNEKAVRYFNSCTNCGFGGTKKNPESGIREHWDCLKR